jgi:hypothetical protein
MRRFIAGLLCFFALGLNATAQLAVGSPMPEEAANLTGFAQTGAKSIGDLTGRAILIEFFAYW